MSFFTGTPGGFEKVSKLRQGQEGLYGQLQQANMQRGAGGSFGMASDYYRDLLDPNSQTAQQMMAPEMRQFNEEIIPGLSEQFAGMGSGGLSSSGFRNAAVNAGTDLSERLGSIRARLREQGAAGLMNMGQQGLQQFDENIYRERTPGLADQIGPIAGQALGAFAGPIGSAVGGKVGEMASNWLSSSNKGKSTPYGGTQPSGNMFGRNG
jgi:hypothetical protein